MNLFKVTIYTVRTTFFERCSNVIILTLNRPGIELVHSPPIKCFEIAHMEENIYDDSNLLTIIAKFFCFSSVEKYLDFRSIRRGYK